MVSQLQGIRPDSSVGHKIVMFFSSDGAQETSLALVKGPAWEISCAARDSLFLIYAVSSKYAIKSHDTVK